VVCVALHNILPGGCAMGYISEMTYGGVTTECVLRSILLTDRCEGAARGFLSVQAHAVRSP